MISKKRGDKTENGIIVGGMTDLNKDKYRSKSGPQSHSSSFIDCQIQQMNEDDKKDEYEVVHQDNDKHTKKGRIIVNKKQVQKDKNQIAKVEKIDIF